MIGQNPRVPRYAGPRAKPTNHVREATKVISTLKNYIFATYRERSGKSYGRIILQENLVSFYLLTEANPRRWGAAPCDWIRVTCNIKDRIRTRARNVRVRIFRCVRSNARIEIICMNIDEERASNFSWLSSSYQRIFPKLRPEPRCRSVSCGTLYSILIYTETSPNSRPNTES